MASLLSVLRIVAFLLLTIVLIPVQFIILVFAKGSAADIVPCLWHRVMCRIYGLRVHVEGRPYDGGGVFFVGNHVSYLDITVIGSIIPVRFVAKREVASWPLFGLLAKLQRTYFINRLRMAAGNEQKRLAHTINEGGRFLIFPEGTSSDGTKVLKFKSASFSMFFADHLHARPVIQPFSIVIDRINGKKPRKADDFDVYAWHGDMELAPHLWNLGKQRHVDIRLIFHETFPIPEDSDRKTLAATCEALVARPYKGENKKVAA